GPREGEADRRSGVETISISDRPRGGKASGLRGAATRVGRAALETPPSGRDPGAVTRPNGRRLQVVCLVAQTVPSVPRRASHRRACLGPKNLRLGPHHIVKPHYAARSFRRDLGVTSGDVRKKRASRGAGPDMETDLRHEILPRWPVTTQKRRERLTSVKVKCAVRLRADALSAVRYNARR